MTPAEFDAGILCPHGTCPIPNPRPTLSSYGKPGASEAEVLEAARAAHADEFVQQLPAGFDTEVGERGHALSGGQKQRLAIARALLLQPKVRAGGAGLGWEWGGGRGSIQCSARCSGVQAGTLSSPPTALNTPPSPTPSPPPTYPHPPTKQVLVLDEVTSALDAASEAAISDTLRGLRSTSTLIIAHRLSTVRRADSIAVIEGGRLVERGSHRQLLAIGGRYAALVQTAELGLVQLPGVDSGSDVESGSDEGEVPGAARPAAAQASA